MKVRNLFLALLVVVCLAGFARAADDVLKVAPKCCTVLLENDEVRVLDFVAKAGEKAAMHTHPDHVVYALTDGKIRFTMEDGTTKDVDIKKGQAIFNKAVTHATENIGSTELHAIIVEMTEEMKSMKH
jgi:quercetin dioxygenase-like cupin family protein